MCFQPSHSLNLAAIWQDGQTPSAMPSEREGFFRKRAKDGPFRQA